MFSNPHFLILEIDKRIQGGYSIETIILGKFWGQFSGQNSNSNSRILLNRPLGPTCYFRGFPSALSISTLTHFQHRNVSPEDRNRVGNREESGIGELVVVTADHSLNGSCGGLIGLGVHVDAVRVAGTEGQGQEHLQDADL